MQPSNDLSARLRVVGPWTVEVEHAGAPARLTLRPADVVSVAGEPYEALPLFDATAAGWRKGTRLRGVATEETSAMGALVPASLVLSAAPDGSGAFVSGRDYALDEEWGTVGRLSGGTLGDDASVYATYRHGLGRIDAIVRAGDGTLVVREGVPSVRLAVPPVLAAGDTHLGNVWIPARLAALTDDHMLPIMEHAFPDAVTVLDARTLPRTMHRLNNGAALTILAWGDSVTMGSYLQSPDDRWQVQFVQRLRQRYPAATITLLTEAWDGHTTMHYLAEPAGALHNYRERVLAARPDLIISEFVNDAGLPLSDTATRYDQLAADFAALGAEWIVMTPHYVRPDWMALDGEKGIDDDPRPYVAFLRRFAAERAGQGIALADAASRWGRLWRQGIPYTTLLTNAINHPDARGMRLFADALLGE